MMTSEREQFVQTLEAAHEFPVRYTFKLIGDQGAGFEEEALALIRAALPGAEPEVSRRQSSQGRHEAVTMVVTVPSAEVVHDLYASFKPLPGLRMLL